ncbi:LysR family transcriptional regulator [Altericroceibacterium endophyticum]|nr:LysR family transcriptional regulator [Altericroceibacterium endophyticum]
MSRNRIDFRHLLAFVEVCEQRHFTRAAQTLAKSQPALSALIGQLEEDLGIPLLTRTTRLVEITPAGKEFLVSAKRIVADLQNAVSEIQDFANLRRGRLRVAALPSLCMVIMPKVANVFASRHAGIDISIIDVPGDQLVEDVTRGRVDFGIGYVSETEMVVSEPIMVDRLVAIASKELFAGRDSLSWRDLEQFKLIAMSQGTTIRSLLESGFRKAGVQPDIVLEPNLMPTAIAYASSGLGVAILPSSGVPDHLEGVVRFDLEDPIIERKLSVIRTRDNPFVPAAAAFLDILREECGVNGPSQLAKVP